MSEMKISERLRVYAAINGNTTLTLTRDQALSLIRICERLEDNNADHEAAMASLRRNRLQIDRLQWLQEMNETHLQWIIRVAIVFAIAKEFINICQSLISG